MTLNIDKARFMLKRESDVPVEEYNGPAGELVVNQAGYSLHIQNGVVDGGVRIPGITRYVRKPDMSGPVDGANDVSRRPTLSCTPFVGDGEHAATHWQISRDGSFATVDFLTGDDDSRLINYAISGNDTTLDPDTVYFARCRHRSTIGSYSEWSDPTSFRTAREGEVLSYHQRLTLSTGEGLGDALDYDDAATVLISGEYRYDGSVQNEGRARIYGTDGAGDLLLEHQMSNPNPTHHETHFGRAVAISGNGLVAAVGAPNGRSGAESASWKDGVVYTYRKVNGSWFMDGIVASPYPVDGGQFGASLALTYTGSRLVVGEPRGGEDRNGAVHVLDVINGQWRSKASTYANVEAGVSNANFGLEVDTSGNGTTLAVGVPGLDKVILFALSTQLDVLTTLVAPISQESPLFGASLALSSDGLGLIVGAPHFSDSTRPRAGRAYRYLKDNAGWMLKNTIVDPNLGSHQYYGTQVAIGMGGGVCAVSAPKRNQTAADILTDAVGAVDIWQVDDIDWGHKNTLQSTAVVENLEFGTTLAMADSAVAVAVGTPQGNANQGDIHIFKF